MADSLVSTLCACLALPTQTSTVVSVKTLVPGTVTVSSTISAKAQATSTVQSTTTVTSTVTVGSNGATLVAGAVNGLATALASSGLTYKKFTHNYAASKSANFNANTFKNAQPDWTGVWPSLNFATDYWPSAYVAPLLTLDRPGTWDASQSALLFQGFFVAPKTGTYTFATSGNSIDNWGYLWTGDNALNWNDANTAFKASRLDEGYADGTTSVVMNAGDALPITWLWANGAGAAQSQLSVSGPDGVISNLVNNLLRPCSA